MLKIKSDGTITMSRGDSVYITVNVYDSEGQEYLLKEGDKLYFSAKSKATDKNYAISPKVLGGDKGTTIEIEPEDTADLSFGTYLYDVQMITANGKCNTIIKPSKLIIEEVITAHGDR